MSSELNESKKWEKVVADGTKIVTETTRIIDGIVVVSKKELMAEFSRTARTVERYIKDGMPLHPSSIRGFQVFNKAEVEAWIAVNIDKVKSSKTSSRQTEMEIDISGDEESLDLPKSDMERKLKADADKAEHDAVIADLKKQKEEGSLISTKELKNTLADLTTVFITLYMNDKKLLPVQLQNKNTNEMRDYLDTHYAKRIEDLRRYVQMEFEGSEESLHDIIYKILEQLRDGVHIDEILKRIG